MQDPGRDLSRVKRLVLVAAAAALMVGLGHAPVLGAQAPEQNAKALPQFTAVSVTPSSPNEKFYPWQRDPSHWSGRRNIVIPAIADAFEVRARDIVGLPAWARKSRYDFQASMPAGTSVARFRLMLQSMLAARFQLKTHVEMRPEQTSLLTVAGQPGPELRPASPSCVPTPNHPKQVFGTVKMAPTVWIMAGCSVSMTEVARYFRVFLGREVADATGLKGRYDINLTINIPPPLKDETFQEKSRERQLALKRTFQKQLGLNLDLTQHVKHPMPVLVIDHIAPATAN